MAFRERGVCEGRADRKVIRDVRFGGVGTCGGKWGEYKWTDRAPAYEAEPLRPLFLITPQITCVNQMRTSVDSRNSTHSIIIIALIGSKAIYN